jgi:hypothetical protein
MLDNNWIESMQEELLQIKSQDVWELVDLPPGKFPIGTKWVFETRRTTEALLPETRLVWLCKDILRRRVSIMMRRVSINEGNFVPATLSADSTYNNKQVSLKHPNLTADDIKRIKIDIKAFSALKIALPLEVYMCCKEFKTARTLETIISFYSAFV